MLKRQIIIGDVHGHYEALQHLLEAIAPLAHEEVYFLGDLIDRGPDSAKVIDFVMTNGYQCVRGNHEEMLLEIIELGTQADDLVYTWLYNGGQATLDSYHNAIAIEHINWLKNLPIYLDLGHAWLVHAGVNPQLKLEQHDSSICCWIRDEFHCMTEPYFQDKLIITGHTITFTFPGVEPGKLVKGVGWLGIDTGVYHPSSYWLTGLDLTNQIVYQYNHDTKDFRKIPLDQAMVEINPQSILNHRSLK